MAELQEGPHGATVERVTVTGLDGAVVETILAAPDGLAATGAIALHPDIMGVRPLFDDLCRRLATHGYAVACPEPFARATPGERAVEDPSVRMGLVSSLDDRLQLGDLAAAADLVCARHEISAASVLGFCMGGMQTLKAAASGHFLRAVACYGMIRLPEAWKGPHVGEPLASAGDVCPTLALFGDTDPWTPASDIDALRAAWRDRPDCAVVVYPGADHGFVHAPERPAHRADDAADAWRRTLDWIAA
ncbi:MAG TPA: dienelactone hydrolase family protein [Acidimicrobiia bacterium]|nr:dienelactone hydrolase family protein [Acidimicrobiia bacterium]